jgi:hypothetical protein
MGVGGKLGDGMQWMSIHLADLAAMYQYAVEHDARAPQRVAPIPITNADFLDLPSAHHRHLFPFAFALNHVRRDVQSCWVPASVTARRAAGFKFRFPNWAERWDLLGS